MKFGNVLVRTIAVIMGAESKKGLLRNVAVASTLLAAGVLPANALIYDVNETIGLGSVIGTVTTDGTFGTNLGPGHLHRMGPAPEWRRGIG